MDWVMAYKDNSNAQVIITVGAVSGFMVIVLAIGLQAWFMSEEQSELGREYSRLVHTELVDLRKKQSENINTYHWVDKDKNLAAVPIEQAMKMLIDNKGKLPNP